MTVQQGFSGERHGAIVPGVYLGTVVNVDVNNHLYVTIERMYGDQPQGPFMAVLSPSPYAPGQRVVIGFIEGFKYAPIVLGIIQ